MRSLRLLGVFFLLVLPAAAEDWTTADGKTYRNVVVVALEDDGVRVTYTGGVGKLPYYELPLVLQKRFGEDYASLEAKRLAAVKALEEATQREQMAEEQQKLSEKNALLTSNGQQNASTATAKTSPTIPANPTPGGAPKPTLNPLAQIGHDAKYPGSRFNYDNQSDVCTLESPVVDVMLQPSNAANPTSATASLQLRITTDGHDPEKPDKIEIIFSPRGTIRQVNADSKANFLVDEASLPPIALEDSGNQNVDRIQLVLPLGQVGTIFNGKNVIFSFGKNNYIINETGLGLFRKYLDDLDRLPPASTNFVKAYHKFISRLPSIADAISEVCTYLIVGSFSIVMFFLVLGFIWGMTRFIKM